MGTKTHEYLHKEALETEDVNYGIFQMLNAIYSLLKEDSSKSGDTN